VQGGIAYRHVFDVPIVAPDLGVVLGAQFTGGAAFGLFDGIWGQTDDGLRTRQFHLGGGYEAIMDLFRIGAEIHWGYVDIVRRTSGNDISSIGIGMALRASVDVFHSDDVTMFVAARIPVDLYFGDPTPIMWGASGMLGLRFQ
jgi:hypothetical protein